MKNEKEKPRGLLRSLFLSEVHVRNTSQFPRRAYRASEVNRQLWCVKQLSSPQTSPPGETKYRTRGNAKYAERLELQLQRPQEKQPQKDPLPGQMARDQKTRRKSKDKGNKKQTQSRPGRMTTKKREIKSRKTNAEMQVSTYIPSHLTRRGRG
ncbi:hypothetical protein NW765_001672 [Fusarium oxysporum]|nr:hypothetical protein NW765_001672 [Fusarium oxysporum]